jgi:hypothetical protein
MSALPNINDVTAVEPPAIEISELTRKSNSGHNPMPPPRIREAPPFKADDSLLKDALAAVLHGQEEARLARLEDRELNKALIAKLANGNGNIASKLQGWAPALLTMIVLGFGASAWFPKTEVSLDNQADLR